MSLRDQRVEKLSIYGPPGIRDFVECTLKFVSVKLGYELQVTEIEPGAIYLNSVYQVRALPLDHRIPAYGYRLDSEGVGVAYCTDTRPTRNSVELGRDADLLIHEATYAQDLADKSWERGHSTAHEAAEIARQAGARRLLLTHFSPRYQDLRKLRDEARKVFPKTDVAKDLHHWKIERKLERTQTQPQPNMQKEAS
jgi:ribonuclease Z